MAQIASGVALCVAEEHVARSGFGAELALYLAERGVRVGSFTHLCARKHLYDAYVTMDDIQFEALCVSVVQAGGGKQPMKDSIIQAIYATKSKATKLKKAQDFILAGLGLGV